MLFAPNRGFAHPYFLYENEFNIALYGTVFSRSPLFRGSFFSQIQGPVLSNFRSFKAHYNYDWLQALQTGIPVVYLSVTKEGTCLLIGKRWGKRNWHMKGSHDEKCADKIICSQELILIILMFSLISRSSLSSSNVGDSLFVVCFSFSIINSSLLGFWDFHDILISQHLLNSVYVGNTGEPSVCFSLAFL